MDASDPRGHTTDCIFGCLGDQGEAREVCFADCLVEKIPDLSNGCARCFSVVALCGADNCALQCIADSSAPACLDCVEDAGCNDLFEECSGLDPNEEN